MIFPRIIKSGVLRESLSNEFSFRNRCGNIATLRIDQWVKCRRSKILRENLVSIPKVLEEIELTKL